MPRPSPRAPLAPLTVNAENGRGRAPPDFPADCAPLRGNDAAKRAMEGLKMATRSAEVKNLRGHSALKVTRKEGPAAASQTRETREAALVRARKAAEELARVRLVEVEALRGEVGEMRAREVASGDGRKEEERAALADEVDELRKEVAEMRAREMAVKDELALARREAEGSAALAEERSVEMVGLREKLSVAEKIMNALREIAQVGRWER